MNDYSAQKYTLKNDTKKTTSAVVSVIKKVEMVNTKKIKKTVKNSALITVITLIMQKVVITVMRNA
jgi:hypothetical protein